MTSSLTVKQLRYVVAVAEQGHFGRAAAACHISQPSLSAQIQQLEERLGVPLFERSRRGVLPTAAGSAVVQRARRVLHDLDDIVAVARQVAEPLAGDFRLGVIPTLGPYLLPRILPSLRAAYPTLRLYLREDLTERLLEHLDSGRLEAALLALPVGDPGFETRPLFEEPFLLAAPADHPLAEVEAVPREALRSESVLLLEDGHCFRDQALEVCRASGSRARSEDFTTTSLETLREMVASRIGVTLLPALACHGSLHQQNGALSIRPFAAPPPSRRIGLVWRRGSAREEELRLLAEFLLAHLPEEVAPAV